MAGPEVYRFVQTPGTQILMCRGCHTHISLSRHLMEYDPVFGFVSSQFAVNLKPANPPQSFSAPNATLVDMHCSGCNNFLAATAVHVQVPRIFFQEGVILLDLPKLLLWDVDTQRMSEATTLVPPNNPP